MDGVLLAGRILFATFFLNSAVFAHLAKTRMLAGWIGSKGVPSPGFAVAGTGLMLLAGSIMIAAGIYGDVGALLIAAFLIPTSLIVHPWWKDTDPDQRQQNQQAFLRNVTFLGACLIVFGLFAGFGEGLGFTVTDPLFSIR